MGILGRRRARVATGLLVGAGVVGAMLGPAAAHPLGNFTINHYAGLRVATESLALDVVIDFAEIPAFQERRRIDTDGDGTVDAAELEAERQTACSRLAPDLRLTVDGRGVALTVVAAGVTLPPGTGGLPTLRIVCEYEAQLAASITAATRIRFEDASYAERIGWREITVVGDGTTISGASVPTTTASARLTAYPDDLLQSPLDVRVAEFTVVPGGAPAPPFVAPDAAPLAAVPSSPAPRPSAPASPALSAAPSPTPGAATGGGATGAGGAGVPGGVEDEITALLEVRDLTPLAILGSILVALVLGALHAVSPGHGKTVMAAYLVGSRGTVRHAVALGLTVTISHTVGVLALALITLFASNLIAPERLYPVLGLISGGLVIAIGLWLLYGRVRAYGIERGHRRAHAAEADHDHAAEADHDHAAGVAHDHDHDHDHDHEHPHGHEHEADPEHDPLEHSHGPFRHRHVPVAGATLTWRSLFTLGLAGGLVPSASALLLLLGSLSANRPAYGIVLVFAFGLGMALVLGGLGVVLVHASRLLEHARPGATWRRLWTWVPAGTALVVVAAGVYMTTQAVQTVF